jgi:hypothetical protein
MPHPLDGLAEAKAQRGRYLIVKTTDGKKSYYIGFGRFSEDREEAISYGGTDLLFLNLGSDCTKELA